VLICIFKLYLGVVKAYFCVWAAFAWRKHVQSRKMDETIKSCASKRGHFSVSNLDYPVWRHFFTVFVSRLSKSCCPHL